MKKIAILNYNMECGGTEKALLALLKAIDYSNYDVTLYLLYKKGPLLIEIPRQVHVEEVQFTNIKYKYYISEIKEIGKIQTMMRKIQRKIYKVVNDVDYESGSIFNEVLNKVCLPVENYDIVCDFSGYGSFLSVMAAKLFNTPVRCMWIHDEKCDWLRRIEFCLSSFNKIFCVSKSVKQRFDSMYTQFADISQVFYNLIDTKEIKEKANKFEVSDIMNEQNTLLTVGRIVNQKGYDIAVRVAYLLKARGNKFKWYFIGDGEKRKDMEKMINEYSLFDSIELLGSKTNPYPYMKKCDMYIQLSRNEGYPVVLIEARALNCVIVASDIPSIREQIINGKNGYLVDLNEEEEIAEKIECILNNTLMCDTVKNNLQNELIDFSGDIQKLYDLIDF